METKQKLKIRERGITLIALVITIIILLILAAVTMAALSGDNGILTNAAKAKEGTAKAGVEEQGKIENMEDTINEYITGIKVEQVTDKDPGVLEGNGTDTDPYIINSIEDLVVFAYNVRNGNSYEGQTVKLGTNLDFNSNKSYVDAQRTDYGEYGYNGELKTLLTTEEGFKPIGTTYDANVSTNYFKGTFDGDYNVIYNLYQNFEDSDNTSIIGFFGTNAGVIENLIIENANISSTTDNMHIVSGVVAGRNSGSIINCGTSGKSKITDNGIKGIFGGGITGQAMGVVEKCFSKINIDVTTNKNSQIQVGGITGDLTEGYIKSSYNVGTININLNADKVVIIGGIAGINRKEISNCYNFGTINFNASCETSQNIYIGSISGQGLGENSRTINCFNIGEINIDVLNSDVTNIGNIIGNCYIGSIDNCYNIGKINIINANVQDIGQIVGRSHRATVNNCYGVTGQIDTIGHQYDSTINNVILIEESEMTDILQVIGENFKVDDSNINNGYPILSWQ